MRWYLNTYSFKPLRFCFAILFRGREKEKSCYATNASSNGSDYFVLDLGSGLIFRLGQVWVKGVGGKLNGLKSAKRPPNLLEFGGFFV